MRKRLLSVVLALVMVLGMLPVEVQAAATSVTGGSCGAAADDDVNWSFNEDTGALTIYGTGKMKDYDNTNFWSVPWFGNIEKIRSILIETGVTHIGSYAFYSCSASAVSISETVKEIGEAAFSTCQKLESVIIPFSVTSIGDGALACRHFLFVRSYLICLSPAA